MHNYRQDYSQGFYYEMRELYNRNQSYSSLELKDFLDFENEDSADVIEYNPVSMISPPTPQPSSRSNPALSPVVITISSSPLGCCDSTLAPLISKEEIVYSSLKNETSPETKNKKLSGEPASSSEQKVASTKDTPSEVLKIPVKSEKSNKETNPNATRVSNMNTSKVAGSYSKKTENPKEATLFAFLRDIKLYCKRSLLKYENEDMKFSNFPNSFKKFIIGMLTEYPNIYSNANVKIQLAEMVVRRFIQNQLWMTDWEEYRIPRFVKEPVDPSFTDSYISVDYHSTAFRKRKADSSDEESTRLQIQRSGPSSSGDLTTRSSTFSSKKRKL